MRYAKNSLVISPERDISLLRQVRNSRFVSHSQLFEFMRYGGFDHSRSSFNWRTRRLVRSGHLSVCEGVFGAGSVILLLQAVPNQPASGAIYLYDRERHIFFFVDFVDGRDDTLTATEFDQLVAEYDLVWWTANPVSLAAGTRHSAMA